MKPQTTRLFATAVKLAAINACIFLVLLVLLELILGNWVRSLTVNDLKRFSIPVNVQYSYSVDALYGTPGTPAIRYSRDQWGLRGNYRSLADIDVLTIGGSTTDQKFIDDGATWQAVAERQLAAGGRPLVFANAGVDGQSTTGHLFDFENWFPLLSELHPRYILYYVGVNDVMRHSSRGSFDGALDASSWRVRSATWQLIRTIRGTLNARSAQVVHGRKPEFSDSDFGSLGLLDSATRELVTREVLATFLLNIDRLRQHSEAIGSRPIFMTQTAYAWHAGRGPSHGLVTSAPVTVLGHSLNFADVSYVHQSLNAALLTYCDSRGLACLDAATEVELDPDDYYDFVHTNPIGARKLGEYVAGKLLDLQTGSH